MNTNTHIPEGSTTEPTTIIPKMDTSLDHALHKTNETSFLSPCSTNSEVPNSERGCQHAKLVVQEDYDTCFHCGAFVSKSGSRTFKSKNMSYTAFFPPKTIYETMIRRSSLFKQSMNPDYSHIRQTYVEWVLELADKLKMSSKSAHLGVLLLDTVMYKDTSLTSRLQLYAPVCLLIAAKTIELDERIPFIPKLRRYANPTFSVDDYRKAELLVLDMVDWNANFSTVLEINEFLMCQGVLFSSDEIEANTTEKEKMSPEALRENTQHGNTNHLEAKADEKKDIGKEQEKTLSPGSKENNENTCSETSTVAATEVLSQQVPQQGEDVSPAARQLPLYMKQHSTPASFETNMSSRRAVVPIEKKAGDIMTHLETSYTKLTTMLLKDIDFIEWEPRVVSASMMAFFRCVNKVTPMWNPELETITQLRFSQISSCFDLIYKRYTNAFNRNSNKVLHVLNTPDSQKELPDLKITRATSLNVEKYSIPQPVPRAELVHKPAFINNAYPTRFSIGGNESNTSDPRTFERKSIFAYQPKTSIPAANPTTASSYNYMRDDLRLRTKFVNGTVNAEIPPRNISRHSNFPSTYLTSRFNAGHDNAANYYTSGTNSSFCTGTGASYPAAGTLIDSSFVRTEAYSSRTSSIPYLSYKADGSYENVLPSYQSKLNALKK